MVQLSEKQLRFARQQQGPCMVIAVAGSGKTTSLIENILNKYESGIPLDQMLITSFSRHASNRIITELERQLGHPIHCSKRNIGTLHSVSRKIYEEITKKRSCLFSNTHISQFERFLKGYCGDTVLSTKNILDAIKWRKLECILPIEIPAYAYIGHYDKLIQNISLEELPEWLAKAWEAYENFKDSRGLIDFEDMLLNTYLYLQDNEDHRQTYQNIYQYVFVDEFQDTNKLQYLLIKLFSEPQNNIVVVGDDDQAIFGYAGSSSSYFKHFCNDYPNAEQFVLDENYRSQKLIINCANSAIMENHAKSQKNIIAMKEPEGIPIMVKCSNRIEEADFIAQHIKNSETNYNEIAILVRLNEQKIPILEALKKYQIPCHYTDGSVDEKGLSELIKTLRIIQSPHDEPVHIKKVSEIYGIESDNLQEQNTRHFYESIRSIRSKLAYASLPQIIDHVLFDPLNLQERILNEYSDREKPGGEIESLFRLAKETAACEDIDSFLHLAESGQFLSEVKASVTLTTIHKAKGLEWKDVYIPGCMDSKFPLNGKDVDIPEERRLMYVGITRAMSRLVFTYPEFYNDNSRSENPSRFLKEIARNVKPYIWNKEAQSLTPYDFIKDKNSGKYIPCFEYATQVKGYVFAYFPGFGETLSRYLSINQSIWLPANLPKDILSLFKKKTCQLPSNNTINPPDSTIVFKHYCPRTEYSIVPICFVDDNSKNEQQLVSGFYYIHSLISSDQLFNITNWSASASTHSDYSSYKASTWLRISSLDTTTKQHLISGIKPFLKEELDFTETDFLLRMEMNDIENSFLEPKQVAERFLR